MADNTSAGGINFHRKPINGGTSASGGLEGIQQQESASSPPSFIVGGGRRNQSPSSSVNVQRVDSNNARRVPSNGGGGGAGALYEVGALATSQQSNQQPPSASASRHGMSVKDMRLLLDAVTAAYRRAAEEEERSGKAGGGGGGGAILTSGRASFSGMQSGGAPLLLNPTSPQDSPRTAISVVSVGGGSSSAAMFNNRQHTAEPSAQVAVPIGRNAGAAVASNPSASVTSTTRGGGGAGGASDGASSCTAERLRLAAACQSLLEATIADLTPAQMGSAGVVDYKTIAQESNKALELLLKMLRADLSMARQLHFIPTEVLEPKVRHLRQLLEDTSKKFGLQLSSNFGSSGSNPFSSNTVNPMFSDADGASVAATGGGDIPCITIGVGTPMTSNTMSNAHNHSSSARNSITSPVTPSQQGRGFNASTGIVAGVSSRGSFSERKTSITNTNNTNAATTSAAAAAAASASGAPAVVAPTAPAYPPPAFPVAVNPPAIAPSELYDARVLFGNAVWREQEAEDQNTILRGAINRLTREKQELEAEVSTMEQQMKQLRDRLSRESDKALRAQQQIEVDLRNLTQQLGLSINSPVENIVGGAENGGNSTVGGVAGSINNHHGGGDSFEAKRANKRPASASNNNNGGGDSLSTPARTSYNPHLGIGLGGNNALASLNPLSPLINNGSMISTTTAGGGASVSSRYQKLEALYFALYEGRGMEMIWNIIDTVYRCEFEAPAMAGSPLRSATMGAVGVTPDRATNSSSIVGGGGAASPAEQQPDGSPASPDSGIESAAAHSLATPQRNGGMSNFYDPYKSFHDLFNAFIVNPLSTENSFNTAIRNVTPLRSDYVANCLAQRVKANSGVVKLLSLETSDARVIELNLSGNYIGDNGLGPIIPLFARMHNLTTLRLANNGLRNDGAIALCKAIAVHPSITSIDLSHNTISRTGGKQLLTLVSTTPRVTFVGLEGTPMDAALKGRIEAAALLNAKNSENQQQQQQRQGQELVYTAL